MTLTYAIPDIHGRVDLLRDAFAAIDQHAGGEFGTIVALGDYVDKGPDSPDVIDLLRAGPQPGWRFIALKGNHDSMMVQALRDPARMSWWLERGGDRVIRSYGGNPSDIPADDIAWLDQLALMHVDRHRIYLHAGLETELALDQQTERTLLWKRYRMTKPPISKAVISCTAMIRLWADPSCSKGAAISTRGPGAPAASWSRCSMTTRRAARSNF